MPLHQPSLDRFGGRQQRGTKWTQPGNLISNGPFILKEWRPNVVLVVARNPRYWDATFAVVENAPDEPARRAAIEDCERIIAEEVPSAPVYFSIRTQLVHPTVRGWRGNAVQKIDWTALSHAAPE